MRKSVGKTKKQYGCQHGGDGVALGSELKPSSIL